MYSVNSLYCIVRAVLCFRCTVYCCTSMYFVQVFCVQVCLVYKNVLCTSMYFCTVSTVVVLLFCCTECTGYIRCTVFLLYYCTNMRCMLYNLNCPSLCVRFYCNHLALTLNSILLMEGNHKLC